MQLTDRLLRMGLHRICDKDAAQILFVCGNIKRRIAARCITHGDASLLHHPGIAHKDAMPVDFGADTVSAALFHLADTGSVDFLSIGLADRDGDGMGR